MSRWKVKQEEDGKVFIYVNDSPYGDIVVGSLYLTPEDFEDLKERLEK